MLIVKNSLFGNLMHSIASLLPGLRYRIQIRGQWHHYKGFTISKKNPPVFAQFCIILVHFGRKLHNCAFSCIIVLNFAVSFPKHHKNSQTGKNGPKRGSKTAQKWPQKSPKWGQNDTKTTPKISSQKSPV